MATAPFQNPSPATVPFPTDAALGQIGIVGGNKGFNGVIDAAATKINDAANSINTQLANYDPTDPGSLLRTQQALATYNLSITVTSSLIKSIEDTTKSVAQKLS